MDISAIVVVKHYGQAGGNLYHKTDIERPGALVEQVRESTTNGSNFHT